MKRLLTATLTVLLILTSPLWAAEKLVLDINADEDMLALSHNIDNFLFRPTMNFSQNLAGDLSKRILDKALKDHLVISLIVRIDGEVAGIATEQETVRTNPETGELDVDSAWLFLLDHPKASGFFAVKQKEGNKEMFGMVEEVMMNPDKEFPDKDHYMLTSTSNPVIELARGGVAAYKGGRFEEYNIINQSEFKHYGRFRARFRFIIHPPEK